MRSLRTVAAKLNGLVHLLHGLRPILCVGGFQREVPQLRNTIGDLLALLQSIEAILILLRTGTMKLIQGIREVVQGLGMIWISVNRGLPVLNGCEDVAGM